MIGSRLMLACQGCALRGHDESLDSANCGNFIELLKYSATLNAQDAEVILENALGNASYTSPIVQNQIMKIMGDLVRKKICEEIGDFKFCILVDESRDESNCEQMAIVLRFVDADGFIRERFFDVIGVEDTTAQTLKKMCSLYDRNGLLVQNIRGQDYDGASNMRVATSGELSGIELFFQMLNCIVNLVRVSPKRNQQLRAAQMEEVKNLMERGELQTSTGGNQQATLRQPTSTRWGSHYSSACSLLGLYKPVWKVLGIIKANGLNRKIRAEASGGFTTIGSFDFVFNLHLMVEIMRVTEVLCQSLQRKDQDILTVMDSISITKTLLCELKNDHKWQNFL
ncbi:zinc finger MYM-type protein 1-like [Asparagus officinalis]|uniref:zinc finger MYM-type protein 1-like n=1 Tax=Asparagus officinalis TaxID=4686 RepID=UPI00098DE29A|nr:zinc finger MYM-type protein 1-like [Asparagus officinalis]